jgi:hypothetical protein
MGRWKFLLPRLKVAIQQAPDYPSLPFNFGSGLEMKWGGDATH